MAKRIYSVETFNNMFNDDQFNGETLKDAIDFIKENNLLKDNDGLVQIALLNVQDDGETYCEKLWKYVDGDLEEVLS